MPYLADACRCGEDVASVTLSQGTTAAKQLGKERREAEKQEQRSTTQRQAKSEQCMHTQAQTIDKGQHIPTSSTEQ
jgi:hypothetical protein